jgi:NADH dehydrogenase FAD-containing subunit
VAQSSFPKSYGGLRVVIAGGGVAALETVLALRSLARDLVDVELVAAEPRFWYRPLATAEPFAAGRAQCFELADIAESVGAGFTLGRLSSVDPDARLARTAQGAELDHGLTNVYAAGDITQFPIKQGGIAAEQADAVAEVIAAQAGASVTPHRFQPVVRAILLTGGRPLYLRHAPHGGGGDRSTVAEEPLWWPPAKIAGRYLAPFLAGAPTLIRQ